MPITYIFTHIPKTAGTSLRYHFQKYLKDQEEFIHFANKGDKVAKQKGLLPFAKRSKKERSKALVVLGHNVDINTQKLIPLNRVYQIVFFRDPVAWEISRYNQYANAKLFRRKLYLDFQKWYELEVVHSQFDWFLRNYCRIKCLPKNYNEKFSLLVEQLSYFDFVGFVDEIDNDMKPYFRLLNVPDEMRAENVTGRAKKRDLFSENQCLREWVVEKNLREIELFSKIKIKFDRSMD